MVKVTISFVCLELRDFFCVCVCVLPLSRWLVNNRVERVVLRKQNAPESDPTSPGS